MAGAVTTRPTLWKVRRAAWRLARRLHSSGGPAAGVTAPDGRAREMGLSGCGKMAATARAVSAHGLTAPRGAPTVSVLGRGVWSLAGAGVGPPLPLAPRLSLGHPRYLVVRDEVPFPLESPKLFEEGLRQLKGALGIRQIDGSILVS